MKHIPQHYRIGHGGYVSEFSTFIDTFLRAHPEVRDEQRKGWYIWWDRQVDLRAQREARDDAVPLPPYYYE